MSSVVVLGAGPAGLAAAVAAADRGVDVTLLDSAAAPGGQIWRAQHDEPAVRAARDHPRVRFTASTTVVHAGSRAGGGARLVVRDPDGVRLLDADALVLATGAGELSLPFPGWDLPGVVTPGAAQAMLKAHGVPIGRCVIVGGTGPFLWPVAAALVRAGVRVAALVEAAPLRRQVLASARLLRHPAIASQAGGYLRTLAAARVPVLCGRAVVAAHGAGQVESVTVARLAGGGTREIAVDAACVGYGFVPSVELARSIGCAEAGGAVVVDGRQATSVSGVFAAGEITGIGGAVVAAAEGTIAGAAAATLLGADAARPPAGRSSYAGWRMRHPAPEDPLGVRRARARLSRARGAATTLAATYTVPDGWWRWLRDDTLMCRCEEVPWGAVRNVLDAGFADVRAVKGQTRCGMGWCQGRVCAGALRSVTASRAGSEDVGDLSTRPFAAPVTVAELADLERDLDTCQDPLDEPG